MNQSGASFSISLGQYMPVDSPVHRLDPRAKIVLYSLVVIALTISTNPIGLLVGLAWVILWLAWAKIPLKPVIRMALAPLPFLLILAVFQFFIPIKHDTSQILLQWRSYQLSLRQLIAAGMLLLRFASLILVLSLSSYTISTAELIRGLEQLLAPLGKVGIPVGNWVLAVQVMLRFLPLLAQVAERISKAQASRGAVWGTRKGGLIQRARQVVPLIIPLFLMALRRAENTALAMEARAFQSSQRTISLVESHFGWIETAALLFTAGAAVLILWI